jgi:hypothetical protein
MTQPIRVSAGDVPEPITGARVRLLAPLRQEGRRAGEAAARNASVRRPPAEELLSGAERMVKDGLLTRFPKPDCSKRRFLE